MNSSILKKIITIISISAVTSTKTRNLNKDESEVLLLREENSLLTQTMKDLRQNYSRLVTQLQSDQHEEISDEDKAMYIADKDNCLQSAIRLLEESVRAYDQFVRDELSDAESALCSPTCYGGDMTYSGQCKVADYVTENIVDPFKERADKLRDYATGMLSALHGSLAAHFGIKFTSGESAKKL